MASRTKLRETKEETFVGASRTIGEHMIIAPSPRYKVATIRDTSPDGQPGGRVFLWEARGSRGRRRVGERKHARHAHAIANIAVWLAGNTARSINRSRQRRHGRTGCTPSVYRSCEIQAKEDRPVQLGCLREHRRQPGRDAESLEQRDAIRNGGSDRDRRSGNRICWDWLVDCITPYFVETAIPIKMRP